MHKENDTLLRAFMLAKYMWKLNNLVLSHHNKCTYAIRQSSLLIHLDSHAHLLSFAYLLEYEQFTEHLPKTKHHKHFKIWAEALCMWWIHAQTQLMFKKWHKLAKDKSDPSLSLRWIQMWRRGDKWKLNYFLDIVSPRRTHLVPLILFGI